MTGGEYNHFLTVPNALFLMKAQPVAELLSLIIYMSALYILNGIHGFFHDLNNMNLDA